MDKGIAKRSLGSWLAVVVMGLLLAFGGECRAGINSEALRSTNRVSTSPDITDHGSPGFKGSLAWWIARVGSHKSSIVLGGGYTYDVRTTLTVPANVNLVFGFGAVLRLALGARLFINGPIEAGMTQIFDVAAPNAVVFGPGVVSKVYPQWWYNGSGDWGPALMAAANCTGGRYGVDVDFGCGTYNFDTTADLPKMWKDRSWLTIEGSGAVLRTNKAIPILRRRPLNQVEAERMMGLTVVLRGLNFVGTGLPGQKGVELACTYGSVIEKCGFSNLGTGCDLLFALMASVKESFAANNVTDSFVARFGDWPGATNSNSQSNNTRFESCRVYSRPGALSAFRVIGSSGVVIKDCIAEGGNTVNNVDFDYAGSTTVKDFRIKNMHLENTPTNAHIRIRWTGIAVVDGIYSQTDAVIVEGDSPVGSALMEVKNIPYISAHSKFRSLGGGAHWFFEFVGNGLDFTAAKYWVGGVKPQFLQGTRLGGGQEGGALVVGGETPLNLKGPVSFNASSRLYGFHTRVGVVNFGHFSVSQTKTVRLPLPGAKMGDLALASAETIALPKEMIVGAAIPSNGTLEMTLFNGTGSTINLGSFTARWGAFSIRP